MSQRSEQETNGQWKKHHPNTHTHTHTHTHTEKTHTHTHMQTCMKASKHHSEQSGQVFLWWVAASDVVMLIHSLSAMWKPPTSLWSQTSVGAA